MTTIFGSRDCDNSPKNRLVQDLAVAIEQGDLGAVQRCVCGDVSWAYPQRAKVVGSDAAAALLRDVRRQPPVRIEVVHAISHGKAGAATGTVTLSSGTRVRFCHVVEFTSARGDRIARITSFYADDQDGPT